MSELDFQKIFASGASSQIDWTDDNYLKGWGYLGNVPPSYQSFDSLQRLNDLKFKYLYDEFMGIETNTEELISNHNENSEAHKTLFDKKLDKNGGTVTGNLNASGYNITATKFIGNLQGKADSAANADLAAKATTAENANNANNSSVANKLGTSTVGSATKPVYINNGVASAVSVDLSTLAPKASPGLTGTPTAPTANVDTNDTQLATCAFVRNAISKYSSKDIDVLKKIMHVGYIHFSTVNINPAELFGFGTWEAMPAGRVLLAQGKVETENYTHNFVAGETGGEFVHQLTVGELPSHNHTASSNVTGEHNHGIYINGYNGNMSGAQNYGWGSDDHSIGLRRNYTENNGSHTHTISIGNTGSSQSHNNMEPYIVVYMWKRTD